MTDNMNAGKNRMKHEIVKSIKNIGIGIIIGIVLTVTFVLVITVKWGKKDAPKVLTASDKPDVQIVVEEEKKQIDIEYLTAKLSNVGELSTAQMLYTGILEVSEGKVPWITKKGFSMLYSAEVKAGIDVSLINITADDNNVYVEIPEASIISTHVDPQSVQFFDEKKALFNWSENEDVTDALTLAEGDLSRRAELDNLIEMSQKEAEIIIKNLLEDAAGDYKVIIRSH